MPRLNTNPNRKTVTTYNVLVNGEQTNSFNKLKEAKAYMKGLNLEEGTKIALWKNTKVEVNEIVDSLVSQNTTTLVPFLGNTVE